MNVNSSICLENSARKSSRNVLISTARIWKWMKMWRKLSLIIWNWSLPNSCISPLMLTIAAQKRWLATKSNRLWLYVDECYFQLLFTPHTYCRWKKERFWLSRKKYPQNRSKLRSKVILFCKYLGIVEINQNLVRNLPFEKLRGASILPKWSWVWS